MKNLKQTIQRAERIQRLLEDKDFQLLFEEIRFNIHDMWENSGSSQEDERERLYREIHGMRAIEQRIKKIINEGKKAEAELKNGN